MTTGRIRVKRIAVAALKLALVAAVLWGMHRTIQAALADLEGHAVEHPFAAAGLADRVGRQLSGWDLLPSTLFWHRLLRPVWSTGPAWAARSALGMSAAWESTFRARRRSSCCGRRYCGATAWGSRVSTATIFYETLTTMAAGAFVAGAILLVDGARQMAARGHFPLP